MHFLLLHGYLCVGRARHETDLEKIAHHERLRGSPQDSAAADPPLPQDKTRLTITNSYTHLYRT